MNPNRDICDGALYPISNALKLSFPILTDVSKRDKVWNKWKIRTREIIRMLNWVYSKEQDEELKKWAQRIQTCCDSMVYRKTPQGIKLQQAKFCRVRVCPICAARKTDIWQAKALQNLPRLQKAFPPETHRFLFLTLTINNCELKELKDTIKEMNEGFARLVGHKTNGSLKEEWPGLGYIKSIEVTRAKDRKAHPHFHVLILVRKDYFSRGYIETKKWVKNWRRAMQLDYDPICDVRAVAPEEQVDSLIETLKYEVKPSDFLGDAQWLCDYARQMRGVRAVSVGGELRDYFKFLEAKSTNMIHGADKQNKASGNKTQTFAWDEKRHNYIAENY